MDWDPSSSNSSAFLYSSHWDGSIWVASMDMDGGAKRGSVSVSGQVMAPMAGVSPMISGGRTSLSGPGRGRSSCKKEREREYEREHGMCFSLARSQPSPGHRLCLFFFFRRRRKKNKKDDEIEKDKVDGLAMAVTWPGKGDYVAIFKLLLAFSWRRPKGA